MNQNSSVMNRTIEKSVHAGLGCPFMKKLLLLAVAMGCVVFCGCEKDEPDALPSLTHSVWAYRTGTADFIWEFTFTTNSDARATFTSVILGKADTFMYHYVYDHPTVSFEGLGNAADLRGDMSDDYKTMTITNISTGKQIGVFSRQ